MTQNETTNKETLNEEDLVIPNNYKVDEKLESKWVKYVKDLREKSMYTTILFILVLLKKIKGNVSL